MTNAYRMKLTHFSNTESLVVSSVKQRDEAHMKPLGLWVSVDGEDDWEQWCISERFRIDEPKHTYKIKLVKDTNVLLIDNPTDLRAFSKQYMSNEINVRVNINYHLHIRWDAVAQQYGGIIIAPYLWQCRMDNGVFWYYSWDCASGCIWDHRCIREIIYRGVKRFDTEDAAWT